jgi:hypothetical protein
LLGPYLLEQIKILEKIQESLQSELLGAESKLESEFSKSPRSGNPGFTSLDAPGIRYSMDRKFETADFLNRKKGFANLILGLI